MHYYNLNNKWWNRIAQEKQEQLEKAVQKKRTYTLIANNAQSDFFVNGPMGNLQCKNDKDNRLIERYTDAVWHLAYALAITIGTNNEPKAVKKLIKAKDSLRNVYKAMHMDENNNELEDKNDRLVKKTEAFLRKFIMKDERVYPDFYLGIN